MSRGVDCKAERHARDAIQVGVRVKVEELGEIQWVVKWLDSDPKPRLLISPRNSVEMLRRGRG